MKKKSIKEFFRQKKVAAGCVAAAVIIAAGSFGINWQSQDAVVFPSYTDPVIETSLTGDDTPLASKPKVTTKKKTSTKTTKKKVKLTYNKVKGAGGYQIVYAQNKKFKKKVAKNTKKTKFTFKRKGKGAYYLKVRAYKKVNKKYVYGKYSKVKKIKKVK